MTRTDKSTFSHGPTNNLGWRNVVKAAGELHFNDLPQGKVLAVLVHFSDLHVCDPESPSRIEYLDRLCDPDSNWREVFGHIGGYRPQEILTTQVVAAMVDAMNELKNGPLTNSPIDAVVVT